MPIKVCMCPGATLQEASPVISCLHEQQEWALTQNI